MLLDVSVFDNLQKFLEYAVELLVQIVHGLRFIPTLLHDLGVLLLRYSGMFPPLIWFVISFTLGAVLVKRITKWGD